VLALQEYAEPEKSRKVEFLAEVVVPGETPESALVTVNVARLPQTRSANSPSY